MTTELEQKFFETFNIPKIFKTTINIGDLDANYEEIQAPTLKELYEEARFDFETPIYFSWFKRSKRWSEEYPQITDRHYLELICVLNKYFADAYQCCSMFASQTIEEIKNDILKELLEIIEQHRQLVEDEDLEDIERCNKLKHQVQAIFKGER